MTFITKLDFSKHVYPHFLPLLGPRHGWIRKFQDASPLGNIDFSFADNIQVACNFLNDRKIQLVIAAAVVIIMEVEHKGVDRQE